MQAARALFLLLVLCVPAWLHAEDATYMWGQNLDLDIQKYRAMLQDSKEDRVNVENALSESLLQRSQKTGSQKDAEEASALKHKLADEFLSGQVQGHSHVETFLGKSLMENAKSDKEKETALALMKQAEKDKTNFVGHEVLKDYYFGHGQTPDHPAELEALLKEGVQNGNVQDQNLLGRVYQLRGKTPPAQGSPQVGNSPSPSANSSQDAYAAYMLMASAYYHPAPVNGVPTPIPPVEGFAPPLQDYEDYMTPAQVTQMHMLAKNWDPKGPLPPKPADVPFATPDWNMNPPDDVLKKASDSGNARAKAHYTAKHAVDADNKAFYEREAKLKALADQGDTGAQVLRGAELVMGGLSSVVIPGVEKNPAEGVALLRKADAKGRPEAAYYLGIAYQGGAGVTKNVAEAVHWFEKAAAGGVIESEMRLYLIYSNGADNVPVDDYKAYMWLCHAAYHGDASAIGDLRLFEAYMTSDELKKARALVAAWDPKNPMPLRPDVYFPKVDIVTNPPIAHLKAAAESGNYLAQFEYGIDMIEGRHLPKNQDEGLTWMRKASDGGNASATQWLASWNKGQKTYDGGPKTAAPAEVSKLEKKLTQQTMSDAQAYLDGTKFYDLGPTTPKDPAAAIQYWKNLTEKSSDPRPFFNLGIAYNRGYGVAKDNGAANFWLTLSVANARMFGIAMAMHPLEVRAHLRQLMTKQQIEDGISRARAWADKHPVSKTAH